MVFLDTDSSCFPLFINLFYKLIFSHGDVHIQPFYWRMNAAGITVLKLI